MKTCLMDAVCVSLGLHFRREFVKYLEDYQTALVYYLKGLATVVHVHDACD